MRILELKLYKDAWADAHGIRWDWQAKQQQFLKRAFLPDTTWKWCRDEVYYINVDGMEFVLYC